MGVTVRQKVPGRGKPWWIYIHRNGQILSRKVGDRRAAEAVASAIRRKLKAGEFATVPKSKTPRFDEYAGRYLETYARMPASGAPGEATRRSSTCTCSRPGGTSGSTRSHGPT